MVKKTALIIGSSGGIGSCIAESLKEDFKLSLSDQISFKNSMNDFQKYGMIFNYCDVTISNSIFQVVDRTIEKFKSIDVLIYCVGRLRFKSIEDDNCFDVSEDYSINALGAFRSAQAVLPIMRKQNSGKIIILSSMQGKRTFKNKTSYAMSKHALQALVQGINNEEFKNGITATAICPGYVDTPMILKDTQDMSSSERLTLIQPKDIANTCKYILNLSSNVLLNEICLERFFDK